MERHVPSKILSKCAISFVIGSQHAFLLHVTIRPYLHDLVKKTVKKSTNFLCSDVGALYDIHWWIILAMCLVESARTLFLIAKIRGAKIDVNEIVVMFTGKG